MTSSQPPKSRLAYIDWMRGLACVLMFQTHCYDSWLGSAARQSKFFMYSQLGGTFPAPLFLFLAGISFALVTEKLRKKSVTPNQIARTTIRRGAEIFAFGLLFRIQEYLIAWGWAPKSDLLRVDILNTIGASMMLMGVMCWVVLRLCGAGAPAREKDPESSLSRSQSALIAAALASTFTISLLTPLLWTTWRPGFLPWPLQSYVNGVHNLGTPQAWLFPIFPWAAFAFAGLATGFLLQAPIAKSRETALFLSIGGLGLIFVELSRWLDSLSQIYPVYDYWHTSPNFFLLRVGMLMMILTASYAWCRWGAALWGFSPLIQLGQASLLVYWVHLEFVYGRFSIVPKRAVGITAASEGLLAITLAMIALAYLRTHTKGWMKGRGVEAFAWLRSRPARSPAQAN